MSVVGFLQTNRLTHLAFKTWFTRRQRVSTQFFSRYSVKSNEIEQEKKESKKKELDVDRVVTECDYERDEIDRRILFEMLGVRLEEDDYPDETSESEEANAATGEGD